MSEAEVEVVAQAIREFVPYRFRTRAAEAAIAALDEVRRSPQGEEAVRPRLGGGWECVPSPQGEDHEAAALDAVRRHFQRNSAIGPTVADARQIIAALSEAGYLSRCPSPERES